MVKAFYSEILDKYFKTEEECIAAEKAAQNTHAANDSAMILQTKLDNIATDIEEFVKEAKEHIEKYHSLKITLNVGDINLPISLDEEEIKELQEILESEDLIPKKPYNPLVFPFPSFASLFS